MSDEPRRKASGPPMCKICNVAHWGVAHVFGGKAGGSMREAKPIVVVVPSSAAKSKKAVLEEMRKPIGLAASLDILMKPPALPAAKAVLKKAEAAAAKLKPKPKRKTPVVAKDGTNRGRPPGKKPFDKKAHDKEMAKKRRDAAKLKKAAGP